MSINFVVFALVLIAWILMMFSNVNIIYSAAKLESLRYFTVLSNLFVGVVSLVYFISQVFSLVKNENKVRRLQVVLAFISTVQVSITFFVVLCFLAPSSKDGFLSMYQGSNLFFHLIVPVLSILNFVIFENEPAMKFRYTPFVILPVLMYGLFYILNNEYHWTNAYDNNYDWYGFIKDGSVGRIILLSVMFIIGTYVVGLLLFFINRTIQHATRGYDDDEGVEIANDSIDDKNKIVQEEVVMNDKVIGHVDNDFIPDGKQVEETPIDQQTKEVKETYSTETGTIHVVTKQVKKKLVKKTGLTKTMTRQDNRYKDGARTYHISRHLLSNTWQVKLANGEKAIKTFKTQKEAIDFAKGLVRTQGGSIRVHSKKGSIRKE